MTADVAVAIQPFHWGAYEDAIFNSLYSIPQLLMTCVQRWERVP